MLIKTGAQMQISATSEALEDLLTQKSAKVIEAKQPDFLYFRARAISAGDQGPVKGEPNPNGNGDYFARAELEKSYQTFIGRNLFLNHESDHPIKSIGKIVDAYAVDDPETGEFYIECLSKIDRKLHPEMARKVETGELSTVSMGCSCEESICSVCGNSIHSDIDAKCEHLSGRGLLQEYAAMTDLPEYGIKRGSPIKAFSINKGLTFNELSIVNVPADSRAVIKTILANLKQQLTKTASLKKEEQLDLVGQLENVLSQLDTTTREQVRAEFCLKMPKEEVVSEEAEIKQIMSKLNGFEFMRLAAHLEKKERKPEVVASAAPDASLVQKIVEKAVNSLAGKLFAQTVKRVAEEAVDKKAMEKCTLCSKEVEKTEGGLCPDCVLRRKHEKKVSFTKNDDLKKAAWSITEGDKVLLTATLDQIWAEELDANKDWAVSSEYGDALLEKFNEIGQEKVAALLGITAKETPKLDKEIEKTEKKLEKEDEKEVGSHLEDSMPKVEKEAAQLMTKENPVWIVRSPQKESELDDILWQMSSVTDLINTIEGGGYELSMSEKWAFYDNEAEAKVDADKRIAEFKAVEELPMDASKKTDKVEKEAHCGHCGVEASALDKVEKIVLEQGFYAVKDKEKNEIVVYNDKDKEVKRIPDGFGDDIPAVMKLLHMILGIEEKKEEVKEKEKEKAEKAEEKAEEAAEDMEEVEEEIEVEGAGKKKVKVRRHKAKPPVKKEVVEPKVEEVKVEEPKVEVMPEAPVEVEVEEPKVEMEPKQPEPVAAAWYSVTLPTAAADKVNDWLLSKNFEILSFGSDLSSYLGKMTEAELQALKADLLAKVGPEDMKNVSIRTFLSREAAVQALELVHKEAALAKKERDLLQKEADIKAAQLTAAISARTEKCRRVVEAMVDRDLLQVSDADIEASLEGGISVIDARKIAFEKAANEQVQTLVAMNDKALEAFTARVYQVRKQASRSLSHPISLSLPEVDSASEDVANIFKSMGLFK